jgi:hypothetical protein
MQIEIDSAGINNICADPFYIDDEEACSACVVAQGGNLGEYLHEFFPGVVVCSF